MSMNLADPVSSGKYSGTCVSTAPVAEPTVVSFVVPSLGSVITATAVTTDTVVTEVTAVSTTKVTTCSSWNDCKDSATPMCSNSKCVAMSCGGGTFSPDGAYDSVWDSVKPMKGKYTINYFLYQEDVGCVCMLNDWISSNDEICADNCNFFQFKLKGKGRSEKWEVYLYGDKTIKVERDSAEVLPRGVPLPGIGGVGFGPSPNLDTDHTIYELCLPSERGMGMSMNLADPVSKGSYSGTCVSTVPVAEPTVVSFTVPVQGSTIVATTSVLTACSSSADCTDSTAPMCSGGVCVAMSCGGGTFAPDGAYDSLWDSVKPMKGKYTINYFQYQEDVGCVCMLNDWISSNDEICPDNYNYFRFKLKGKGRSEKWEVYLYGDKTIKIERDSAEVLPRGVAPPGIGGVGFGPSPNLDTKHTIYELCLPSERGMEMSMNLADPVSSGKYSGTCVSTVPVAEPTVMSFTVP